MSTPTCLTSKSRPLAQSMRPLGSMPHGFPLRSSPLKMLLSSDGEVRLDEHLVAAHVDDVVDVLDVDGALLDAGAAVDARPQHVGVDDGAAARMPRVALGRADECALGLGDHLGRQVGALVVAVGEQVRRLGERVVAQAHDEQLRAERLLGVPRRALALAAAALGAAGEVEHALPAEVLDLADAELLEVLLLELLHRLHVDRLAACTVIGLTAPSAIGRRPNMTLSGAMKMCRCLELQHDDEEDQHDADVQQQADVLERLVGASPSGVEPRADDVRHERAVAVREVAGDDAGPAEQEHRPDDE